MDNIFSLHDALGSKIYKHGGYQSFKINDPKSRDIHKAVVRDRLLHHAIYRILYPFFDKKFITDSFSCRNNRGTHKALNRFREFAYKSSKNNTKACWVLKCDIQKFFANINHAVLLDILRNNITDKNILWLLGGVIESFSTLGREDVGLPLGNLTSQLLVNIYMNEFDQYMKHKLKAKCYIRYADDFVILSEDRKQLEDMIPEIRIFLAKKLKLELHSDKLFLKTLASGVDFLGWVHFPDHRVLRTATKRRMIRNLEVNSSTEAVNSYLGMLAHGNAHGLSGKIIYDH